MDRGSILVVARAAHAVSFPANRPGCSDLVSVVASQPKAVLRFFASWFRCGAFRHAPLATITLSISLPPVSQRHHGIPERPAAVFFFPLLSVALRVL